MSRVPGTCLRGLVLCGIAVLQAAAASASEWNFRVSLDGTPIGEHRFVVSDAGNERRVASEASFVVKLLGITAYRYRHSASERWRGNCLARLVADTDDGGKLSRVRLDADGAGPLSGCAMSFAYWNPAVRTQTRLLNAQTGQHENVQVRRIDEGVIDVRGTPTPAVRWRITGPAAAIDVWYATTDEWIGLDSTLESGRKLSYRLP
jgi:hypothetical protein